MLTDYKVVGMRAAAALVLAALAYAMVLAYGWYGQSVAMGDGAEAEVAPGGVPGGAPGAPTRAQVKQLHGALLKRLGTNARGLPRVSYVDYESWPDRLLVVFALDRNLLTMSPAEAAELRPFGDVLRGVHAGGLQWKYVLVCGTAPVEAAKGRLSESTVVRALYAREKLDGVDWSRVTPQALEALAEQFTVEPDLEELRPGAVKPHTQPATRPHHGGI